MTTSTCCCCRRIANRSCREIRAQLKVRTGVEAAVLIIDSLGRAWRNGTVGVALGAAGLPALLDQRGRPDLFGRMLRADTDRPRG